ncbi:T9SS type A sorting domain-containing protein [Pontibacter roseus]|uniref:T9SS type A sorting domain-containing protein n=1 Tax=Pontibacter roseus TaxID=336989 RepID=UPI00037E87CD|nr:T9SS type A sorting domain-containing protein [Pontibacter roseus]
MEKHIHLFRAILCTVLLIGFAQAASAQTDDTPCFYTDDENPEERCIAIGYASVTPYVNQPGDPPGQQLLNVRVVFQACDDVTEISISRPGGSPIVIAGDDITGEVQDIEFQINARAFQNNNDLRLTIEFTTGDPTTVEIVYTGDEECENILEEIFPLPVELVSFSVAASPKGISLSWRTASELENKHFEVERSTDGHTFTQIGIVPGHGTTSIPKDYTFEDKRPADGTSYYRLKQVDFDGQYEYSYIVAAENAPQENQRLVVAPNPCLKGDCEISLGRGGIKTETLLELKDMTGRAIFSKTLYPGDDATLRLEELKKLKGLYLLTATTKDTILQQRLLVE